MKTNAKDAIKAVAALGHDGHLPETVTREQAAEILTCSLPLVDSLLASGQLYADPTTGGIGPGSIVRFIATNPDRLGGEHDT